MKHKKRRPKGMLPKKRRMYQNGGGVGDPPQGTITPQEALMRAMQPDNQFRLTGGDAPFRTIKQEQDRMTAETVDDSMFEMARFLPVIGEGIDAAELAKVAATGEDFYGEEQDPALFAGMTAAGYLIPNILEKPLKSAWRAVKKFPAKLPKREFRELPTENKEAILQNLTQAHEEAYPEAVDFTMGDANPNPHNVRQLPSLMSGSKLENAVGKDGMIQVSQIENLINSKDLSAAEKEALKDALFKSRVRQGEALGLEPGAPLPDKIDYLDFKRAGMGNMNRPFRVEESDDYADYGLYNLGYQDLDRYTGSDLEAMRGDARTNLILTTDPELQSTEYGHFGRDVIGHYRTFERPDEKGVLYISELQADPLQARGSAGQKRIGLNVIPSIREYEVAGQISAIDRSIQEVNDLAERVSTMTSEELELFRSKKTGPGGNYSLEAERALSSLKDIKKDLVDNTSGGLGQGQPLLAGDFRRRETAIEELKTMRSSLKKAKEALEGGYRGGPNPKQAALIKNQDQFLISHILEQEAKGADKLRFPTGETTSKIQGYGDQSRRISRAKDDVKMKEARVKANRESSFVKNTFKRHPMFKGKSDDEAFEILNTQIGSPDFDKKLDEGYRQAGMRERSELTNWYFATQDLRSAREHLSRINASEQATQGIMKGYDRLPKALKKHGLDATKVTDDVGNTWWEVDIPARLGEGVGEIRAYKKGGKFRILKK